MVISKYNVRVEFDVAVVSQPNNTDKLCLELNQLFHDMVKAWAKDKNAIVTPTRTTLQGEVGDE